MMPPIVERLRGHMQRVRAYDSEAMKAHALQSMSVAQLSERARPLVDGATESGGGGGAVPHGVVRDCELKALLKWFKDEFFTWVDTLPCERCGAKTTHGGSAEPSAQDLHSDAARVELHRCTASGCGHATRFPRYNDPIKLLETRRGR
jgi:peptide-N4-(N-acetyl-beta-glucosaminyl)asparagine amidase